MVRWGDLSMNRAHHTAAQKSSGPLPPTQCKNQLRWTWLQRCQRKQPASVGTAAENRGVYLGVAKRVGRENSHHERAHAVHL